MTGMQNAAKKNLQVLQVFNSGRPCGWLGHTAAGFWFHYSSNSLQQNWVSLLMPPRINFYQSRELFPVFAQHLPQSVSRDPRQALAWLEHYQGNHLGSLSFANPDQPVIRPLLRSPADVQPGQTAFFCKLSKKPFADTQVQHVSLWAFIQNLRHIKKTVDPDNRLQGLGWTLQASSDHALVTHPRPDFDPYLQQLLGFEHVNSLLKLTSDKHQSLILDKSRFKLMLHEVIRTYCKYAPGEIRLLDSLFQMIQKSEMTAHIVYRPTRGGPPEVLGMEYLPSVDPCLFNAGGH